MGEEGLALRSRQTLVAKLLGLRGRAGRPDRPGVRLSGLPLGVATIVLVSLVCGVLALQVSGSASSAAQLAARKAGGYTPPPASIAGSTPAYTIALIGDASVDLAAAGPSPSRTWPEFLGAGLDARILRIDREDAGYTVGGGGTATFVQAAARLQRNATLVVFVGGSADAGASRVSIARAATQAFAEARRQAPGAHVVAVGPLFVGTGASEARLRAVRIAVRSAAGIAEVQWIDPIADRWISGVKSFSGLDEAEHYSIAERLQVQLRPQLPKRAADG